MRHTVFSQDFVGELRGILLSTSTAEIYDRAGKVAELKDEPFLAEWQLRSLAFDPQLGPSRVVCQLYSGAREVTATIDAGDFHDLLGKRSRSRMWNNSRYHDAAVLVSVLIQEQILTVSPGSMQADLVRIRLPKDRDNEAGSSS